jgi:hypothetical protein
MIQQRLEREEQAKRERKAKEEQTREKNLAAGLNNLSEYLTEHGFKENELWELAQYGTADLQRQLEKADEFDKGELKKQIVTKQNEIKGKKFFLTLPYTTTNLKVNDTVSSVEILVPLRLFVDKMKSNPNLPPSTKDGFYNYQCKLLENDITIYSTEAGRYDTNREFYGHATRFEKDGKIAFHTYGDAEGIAKGKGGYWAETNFSILHILVSDKTETIKKLVRQKENYGVNIQFANLFWGRPKSYGYFEPHALEKLKSTEALRKTPELIKPKTEVKDIWANPPTYLVTQTGDEVEERVMADIIDVQIVEIEK